ncbi:Sua5/YciO/YrdC/YwlC family protein [Candidatus Woesearchaeota archaeon]|nr:Sua5/YciO/YrdC/YwlC family protein [Candidatus Woesearchaeota archaeon]
MQITLNELLETQETQKTLIDCILNGRIIIYPTDTVYGIGCDATNNKAVERLRHMKQTKHPLSVIAPSMTWISDNFTIKHEEFLSELPGKITLILEKKNKTFLKHCSVTNKLGISITEHPIT